MGLNHMQNRAKNQHVKMTCSKSCHAKNKLFHVSCKKQAVPHVMQKTSCSTCHAMQKTHAKPCKKASCSTCHAKTMQKPCKTMQNAARTEPRRTLTVPRVLAICAIWAIWVLQGKPLNIHSPRVPCYMCYMCYMALYRFLRVQNKYIAPGESGGSAAWRVRPFRTYSAYSKEPGDCGGSAAWRTRGTVPLQQIGLSALSAVGGRIPHCGQL